jgi:hypothetical protein
VLASIDFNDQSLLETHKVENKALKRNLAAKLELPEPSVAKQSPHRQFRIGWFTAHLLGEVADAFGSRTMVWRLRREPLTRRRTSFGATLSHKGRGKIGVLAAGRVHTRIGIST